MADPKVVAKRGESSYLLDIGDDQGRVLDVEAKILYPPMFLPSIVARGYWEPAEVTAAELQNMLDGVEDRAQARPVVDGTSTRPTRTRT